MIQDLGLPVREAQNMLAKGSQYLKWCRQNKQLDMTGV
jgi:hypothetical protein